MSNNRSMESSASASQQNLPDGFRIRWSGRTKIWESGRIVAGGSPWRLSQLHPVAHAFIHKLRAAGAQGLELRNSRDRAIGRVLLDRGLAHPVNQGEFPPFDPQTIVPFLGSADELEATLTRLGGRGVIVIDDGSASPKELERVAVAHGTLLIHHETNMGPASARNTGAKATDAELIAFIDSDCTPPPNWAIHLSDHFRDPAVGLVAARVQTTVERTTALKRYESVRSSLDMGAEEELVKPGARLGFVPSAAIVVRRKALDSVPFDAALRLGEDVDIVWRLDQAGWLVRYDPSVVVGHAMRDGFRAWAKRKFEYGTSAPQLDERHNGYLTPAQISAWNLTALAAAGWGSPTGSIFILLMATFGLKRHMRNLPSPTRVAARVVAQGFVSDSVAIGHLLRREWWPIGATCLALSPRSRFARLGALCMIAPIVFDWARHPAALDPIRYVGLRLIDDAAYGSGVCVASIRERRMGPLSPTVKWPWRGPARLRKRSSKTHSAASAGQTQAD